MKGGLVLLDWLQNGSFLFFPSISSSAHLGIPPEGSGKKVWIALFFISYIPSLLYYRWTWFAPQCVFLREVLKGKGQIIVPVMWKAGKELAGILSLLTILDVFCMCLRGASSRVGCAWDTGDLWFEDKASSLLNEFSWEPEVFRKKASVFRKPLK